MRNIFLDLDGTIIDVSKRYLRLYKDLIRKYALSPISDKTYLDLKRKKIPEKEILMFSTKKKDLAEKIANERVELIEDSRYLKFDKLTSRAIFTLKKLSLNNTLYLVTNRKNERNLKEELSSLGIDYFFENIFCNFVQKSDVISVCNPTSRDVVIGDTEEDVAAAKKLGLLSIAIASGVRDTELLKSLNPTFLAKNLHKAIDYL